MADLQYLAHMGLGDCSHMTVEQRKIEMLEARYYATLGSSWSVKNLKFPLPRTKHGRAKKGLEPDEPVLIRVGGALYETIKTRYWKNFEYELARGQIEYYDLMKNTTLHLSPKRYQDPNSAYTKELYNKHFDNYNISKKFVEDMATVLKHVNSGKTVARLRDYVVSWKKQFINKNCLVVKVMKGSLHSYQVHLPPADSFMFESFSELLTKEDLSEIRTNYQKRIMVVQERSLGDPALAKAIILKGWDVNNVYLNRYAPKSRTTQEAKSEVDQEDKSDQPLTKEQRKRLEKKQKEREKKRIQKEKLEKENKLREEREAEESFQFDMAVSALTLTFNGVMAYRRQKSLEALLSSYVRYWKSERDLQMQRFSQGIRKCKHVLQNAAVSKVVRRFLKKVKWKNLVLKRKEKYKSVILSYISETKRSKAKIEFWRQVLESSKKPAQSLFSFKPRKIEYQLPPKTWYGFKLNDTLYLALEVLGIDRDILKKTAKDDFLNVKIAVRELSIFFRSKNFIRFCNDHSTVTREAYAHNKMESWVAKFLVGEELTRSTLVKSALAFGITVPGRKFSTYILNNADEIVSKNTFV